MEFKTIYAQLNSAQKEAVDTIDGPLLVLAGPGTGKTQLLSARVANILKTTDTLPGNILCITFTESGATAMRERLISMIGEEAYHVGIYTFHSFCLDIINRYNEHFFNNVRLSPVDELTGFQILEELFSQLSHSNKLSTKFQDEFTYLKDTQNAIAELKQAGITADELRNILKKNTAEIEAIEPRLQTVFSVPRLSKAILEPLRGVLDQIVETPPVSSVFPALSTVLKESLEQALFDSEAVNSTKPITAWRNEYLEKDGAGKWVMKDHKRADMLVGVASIYEAYLQKLRERRLLDFDDMILEVMLALERNSELRNQVQEQFQYVLVDEFQDTNGAQLRIIQALGNNTVNEGRPNIMAVGDDDQAIYAFQGAQVSNMREFMQLWREPKLLSLDQNYRSTESILKSAHQLGEKIEQRISRSFEIGKRLIPHTEPNQLASTKKIEFRSRLTQQRWVSEEIASLIKSGVSADQIAVLSPKHAHLQNLAKYLLEANIPVAYERRDNVLNQPHIAQLVQLARLVHLFSDERFGAANGLFAQVLSYPFWGIPTKVIWQISLDSYKNRCFWLETMLASENEQVQKIAQWIAETARSAKTQSLETVLDILVGVKNEKLAPETEVEDEPEKTEKESNYTSPFKNYYFSQEKLATNPAAYLELLSNLRVLRNKLREFRSDEHLKLADLLSFIALHERTNTTVIDTNPHLAGLDAVQLMTAYKSKGLEFHTVFIIDAQDSVWGEKSRSRSRSIKPPHNLPIERAGEKSDDRMRLLYVAMTRAKQQLFITSYELDENDKPTLPVSYLSDSDLEVQTVETEPTMPQLIQSLELDWHDQHIAQQKTTLQNALSGSLENYQLSPTHLNNFLDVTRGGPQTYLLHNLLRFPESMSPSATYGSAIHSALHQAHMQITTKGTFDIPALVTHFTDQIKREYLSEQDEILFLERGEAALKEFLKQCGSLFSPSDKSELNFKHQGVVIEGARLTGAIDNLILDPENKTAIVVDYKTGKAPKSTRGKDEFERIKLYKYRQQLNFYKLLVEHSRDYSDYTVTAGKLVFVEPSRDSNECVVLDYDLTNEDIATTKKLIVAVWRHIMNVDLPDISSFELTLRGIEQFESELLKSYNKE